MLDARQQTKTDSNLFILCSYRIVRTIGMKNPDISEEVKHDIYSWERRRFFAPCRVIFQTNQMMRYKE